MKKIFNLITIILLFATTACEQTFENGEINLQNTNTTDEWKVNAYIDGNMIFGPFTITTQTQSNYESMTIKDNGAFWKFQTKAKLSNSMDEFSCFSSINEIGTIEAKINILDGCIINKDSIFFKIQFEDDETPYGFTYQIKGHSK